MKCRIFKLARRILLFLLLGAIINVAVAWGCSIWSTLLFEESEPSFGQQSEFQAYCRRHGLNLRASPGEWTWKHATMVGVTWYQGWSGAQTSDPIFYVQLQRAGWPRRSVECTGATNWPPARVNGFAILDWNDGLPCPSFLEPSPTGADDTAPPLPYRPIWPGFAINTIFYAAALWLPFAAVGRLRRRRRIKRGLCPACAYPVGDSAVCTECGNQLRVQAS